MNERTNGFLDELLTERMERQPPVQSSSPRSTSLDEHYLASVLFCCEERPQRRQLCIIKHLTGGLFTVSEGEPVAAGRLGTGVRDWELWGLGGVGVGEQAWSKSGVCCVQTPEILS